VITKERDMARTAKASAAAKKAAAPKKTAAKKTAAKKTAAKKTAAKKTAAKGGTQAVTSDPVHNDAPPVGLSDTAPDSEPIPATGAPTIDADITKVARQVLNNNRRWGTGRDRDTRLAKAGYNLDAVRREVRRLRAEGLNKS
jgi:hypothetical protein